MKKDYSIKASPVEFLNLLEEIRKEFEKKGRNQIDLKRYRIQHLLYTGKPDDPDYVNQGDVEIFIHSEITALHDKGMTIIVKDWNGEKSKLTIAYGDKDDWELAQETWSIFEKRIEQNGWNLTPVPTYTTAPPPLSAQFPMQQEQITWSGKLSPKQMGEQVETLFDFICDFFRIHQAVSLSPEPYWGVFQIELTGLQDKSLAAIVRIKKCAYENGEYKALETDKREIGRIELVPNTHASYSVNVSLTVLDCARHSRTCGPPIAASFGPLMVGWM